MEQPLEPLNAFRPRTGTPEQWNAAFIRVEDYLRAHRVHNRLQQITILEKVIARAARRHEASPALEPTTLAAEEVDRMMDEWFGELLDHKDLSHERIAVEGRVALFMSDGVERWPYAFLDERQVPPEFAQEMQRRSIQAGPVIAMVLVPALLMVSTIRFRSFKTFDLQTRRSYTVLLLVAIVLALFAAQPDYLFVVLAYGYLLSAFVEFAWSRLRRRPPGDSSPGSQRHEGDAAVLDTPDTKITKG